MCGDICVDGSYTDKSGTYCEVCIEAVEEDVLQEIEKDSRHLYYRGVGISPDQYVEMKMKQWKESIK